MASSTSKVDRELAAIGGILKALDGLDGESIQRVLDYVFGRLSIAAPRALKSATAVSVPVSGPADTSHLRRASIRDLKDEKQPESSNQMAALIAYYLSEVAEEPERKDEVSASDLERYFKQAGFRLPKSLPQTLPNAAAAGYFDATGNGRYKLNAVGYNLIAHGLPRTHTTPPKRSSKRIKKKSKRTAR